ncbi:hypothetical protein HanRHA438_Chr17g0837911 [Helianthus annuus]|nr:hypothetical protein HanHA300_Chr17g0673921 [Helianthus annuus]KAJ0435911.1 hypothetical protein HanIR_Chr17g0898651 [Helianthus annuus]KAJ0449316.1 hypothetical protein HanHA89_Chr17g0727081 [Helianthus annuus]KAJ0637968.1 hypothetical protein HanOQP8_Chr17g0680021 [Helianthus annuus]KAJ0828499.1 hypothetical protein HanRHA438_Chr17g0837911 [Helianthus annuus]
MVFSGEKQQPSDEQMERLKPLHNFDLPCLKWGNQKLLRCMKADSKGDVSAVDRRRSAEYSGGGGGVSVNTRRRDVEFERRFRSSDDRKPIFSSSEKMKAVSGSGDGEIEATREKLMFDFQTEVGKMKDAILRGSFPASATVPATTSSSPAEKPWNLRTRRAACKSPARNGDDRKPNFSPARNEGNKSPVTVAVTGTVSGEKREREKFSVALSRRELEEDFTAMTGRRLPRKPKKRPRYIQKQLDTLFPGLWLSEITADLYRVPDDTEPGKR